MPRQPTPDLLAVSRETPRADDVAIAVLGGAAPVELWSMCGVLALALGGLGLAVFLMAAFVVSGNEAEQERLRDALAALGAQPWPDELMESEQDDG